MSLPSLILQPFPDALLHLYLCRPIEFKLYCHIAFIAARQPQAFRRRQAVTASCSYDAREFFAVDYHACRSFDFTDIFACARYFDCRGFRLRLDQLSGITAAFYIIGAWWYLAPRCARNSWRRRDDDADYCCTAPSLCSLIYLGWWRVWLAWHLLFLRARLRLAQLKFLGHFSHVWWFRYAANLSGIFLGLRGMGWL